MRKLTVDDIVDHRAYERERDEFRAAHHRDEAAPAHRARRPRHHRVREHRHHALPGAGDGTRRAHAHRRRHRRRGRHLQRADPRRRRAVGHVVHRAHRPTRCSASGCRSCVDIEFHVRFELGRRRERVAGRRRPATTRSGSRATTSPSTVHYLQVPVRRRAAASCSRTGPARLVVDHPEYQVVGRAHRRAARRARRRLRATDAACRSRSSGSIPSCRCRASSTPTTPATTCTPASGVELAPAGGRASCPPASRSRSRPATPASCCRARGSR